MAISAWDEFTNEPPEVAADRLLGPQFDKAFTIWLAGQPHFASKSPEFIEGLKAMVKVWYGRGVMDGAIHCVGVLKAED